MSKLKLLIICSIIVIIFSACQKSSKTDLSDMAHKNALNVDNNMVNSTNELNPKIAENEEGNKEESDEEQEKESEEEKEKDNEDNGQQTDIDRKETNSTEDNAPNENTDKDQNKSINDKEENVDKIENQEVNEKVVAPPITELLTSYEIPLEKKNYYYISMNVIDGYVYMIRDDHEENKVQLLGMDLHDPENSLRVIHEGSGLKGSGGTTNCFMKTKDGQVLCTLDKQLIWIDSSTHELIKTEAISSDIIDMQISHNEQMKSYVKEDLNIYINSDKTDEKLIEEGCFIEDAGGLGMTIYIPERPRWSLDDTYLAYDIGLYESCMGPTITDALGNSLINCNLEVSDFGWLNDHQLVVAQENFEVPFIGVLDMNTYEFSYLIEGYFDAFTCNSSKQSLIVSAREPYNHIRIFNPKDLNNYLEIPIATAINNNDYIFSLEDKVYIIKDRRDKIYIDVYPMIGNQKFIQPKIRKYPKLDQQKKWFDIENNITLYGNEGIDAETGSVDLFLKVNDNGQIYHIGSYFGASADPQTIPLVNTYDSNYFVLVNQERLMEYYNGRDFGLSDYYEGLPNREFTIKASHVCDNKYAYLISYSDDTFTYYELYENNFDKEYRLIDTFKMNVSDHFWNDFKINYDKEGNLYYDYYDINSMTPMIKCHKINGEIITVMDDALQVNLLSGGDLVQYTRITGFSPDERNESYQILYDTTKGEEVEQFKGKIYESEDYLVKQIYGDNGDYSCEVIDKTNYQSIKTIKLNNPYILHVVQEEDEIHLYVIDFEEYNYDIKEISVPII